MESRTPGAVKIAERLPAVITAAAAAYLLVATTVGFHWIESWHDEQRAAQIVLLGVVALAAAWLALARSPSASLRFAPSVLATLTLGVISSLLCDRPLDALSEVALFGLLCVLAATVACLASTAGAKALPWVSRAALFIAAAHVVGAFTRYAAAVELAHSLGSEIWLVGFSNPRVASSFYALLIPFVAICTAPHVEPDRRLRGAAWVMLVGLWAVATGLEARALWLSYAVALPALLAVSWTPAARRVALTVAATALVGVLIQFALPLAFSGDSGVASTASRDFVSLSARDVLWRLAFDATLSFPVLGVGPGQFTQFDSYAGAHPHNWMLQLAAEWGIPALLVTVVGIGGLVRRVRPSIKNRSGEVPLLAAASLSAFVGLVSALVDGTLVMPTTQVEFALAFGALVGIIGHATARRPMTMPSLALNGPAPAALVLAAALGLGTYAFSTYGSQASEKAAFQQRFPGKWLVPRFWENGLALARPRPHSGH